VAAIVNAWLLYRGLRRRKLLSHAAGWRGLLLRIVVANSAMIVVLVWLQRPLDWWIDASFTARSLQLGMVITSAAIAYFAALAVSGLRLSQLRLTNRQ